MKRSNRRYRIKSPLRFITFLVIVAGLIVGIFGYASGFNVSTALVKPSDRIAVEIVSGDTLWDIAYQYKSSGKDIRKAVYEICQANNIEDGHIEEGMIIEIPQSL
ncbi:MAG: LysM peptidoglycan-binding domain-containing protein [Bacillota bacterium]|nr:LysM peptidoglycan-binding domain-containing protein [Bacillota bacterium]